MSSVRTIKRPLPTILLVWFAMVGLDFLLHAGLLSRFYITGNNFLLSPLDAFQRIPLGYAALLLQAILLVWLVPHFSIGSLQQALWFGLKLGLLLISAQMLGLVSITTIEPTLAIAWFVSQTLEVALGAVVVQQVMQTDSLRRVTIQVTVFVLFALILTITLQSLGLSPAVQIPQ
jgi:hypothetical protein